MPKTAVNALIQYEQAQEKIDYTAMTDSGDHTVFTTSDNIWSARSGYEAEIRPDGIVSGTNLLTPGSGNDAVDCAAFTCYIGGELISVSEDTIAVDRSESTGSSSYLINSITFDGSTLDAVAGTEGTAFSATRGAAGGPPFIPVGSIEVGQIKLSSVTPAAVTTSEIFQSPNNGTQERYDFPIWYSPSTLGDGNMSESDAKRHAHVEFSAALPATHTGSIPKGVYIMYHTPVFVTIEHSSDFSPAEESVSASSKQIYRKTVASTSKSLGGGSFKMIADKDGITDGILKLAGELLTFRYYPDENKEPYSLTQAYISFKTTNSATDNISIDATLAAPTKTVRFDE